MSASHVVSSDRTWLPIVRGPRLLPASGRFSVPVSGLGLWSGVARRGPPVARLLPNPRVVFGCLLLFAASSAQALDPNSGSPRTPSGAYSGRRFQWNAIQDHSNNGWVRMDRNQIRLGAPVGEKLPFLRIDSLLGARDGSRWIGIAAGRETRDFWVYNSRRFRRRILA